MSGRSQAVSYLEKQLLTIEKQMQLLDKRLKNAPAGSLCVSAKNNKYQYYQRFNKSDKHGTYIPRKKNDTAIRLAQKEYDLKLLEALEQQKKLIERFLKKYDPHAPQSVYEKMIRPKQDLISKGYLTDEEFVAKWLNAPYDRMGFRAEDPEYYTNKGERVRSKSELIIANELAKFGIPYRYEYPIYEDNILLGVPDFNCLNVKRRKDYYWEHLGMLGNPEYVNHNVKKMEQYALASGFDESALILTFESDKHPLNTRVIEEKIRRYLL